MSEINDENLRTPRSTSEAREWGRKGGINSGKSRRKRKRIADTVKVVLSTQVTDSKQLEVIRRSGLPVPKSPTFQDFIIASIMMQAIKKGKIEDIERLMRITGESTAPDGDYTQVEALNSLLSAIGGDFSDP